VAPPTSAVVASFFAIVGNPPSSWFKRPEWTLGASGEQQVLVTVKNLQDQLVQGAPLSFKATTGTIIGKWTAVSVKRGGYDLFKNVRSYTEPNKNPNCIEKAIISTRVDEFDIEFKLNYIYTYQEKGYYKYIDPCNPRIYSDPNYSEGGTGKYVVVNENTFKIWEVGENGDDDFTIVKFVFNDNGELRLIFLDENDKFGHEYTLKRIQ